MAESFSSGESADWLSNLHQQAIDHFHRVALVLSGEKDWCYSNADYIIKMQGFESVLTISENMSAGISSRKARTQLGKEYDAIAFDAYHAFDIDAFAAVSGTLCGGGFLILIVPEESNWQELKTSRFLQRALPDIKNYQGVYFIRQNEELPEFQESDFPDRDYYNVELPYRTVEQKQVINAIQASILRSSNTPVVLISDRGRGKSSALGLASGALIQQGVKNIIVTAPRLSVSDPVFRHAEQILIDAVVDRGKLQWQGAELKFIAPDTLLMDQPEADLLLIDEAAAIPLAMLEKLLRIYPQIIFSTTIHGYEGTGRGFALKFNKVLDQYAPNWQQFNMTTPVRWAVNDPVEGWIDKLLCLDSEMPAVPSIDTFDIRQCKVCLIDRDELIHDDRKLSSLFSLLIYAHYRTQPSDLRHLLDDEHVHLYTLELADNILAVALISREGGFDAQLSTEIYRGLRRPQGNLLPQTLTFHAGCEQAATLNYARIMRIAVHPELQQQGLGTYLLKNIVEKEKQHVDVIGTSFGATVELLSFWKKAGFEMVRMGFTRDHASGAHSAVMMMPFSERGCQVFSQIRKKFQYHLSYWLAEPLRYLSSDIRRLLERQVVEDMPELSNEDWKDIYSFIDTHRGYEACMGPINKLLKKYSLISKMDNDQNRLI
ncbi:MAG: GNAT family N-acetyltransferase, partial [Gammaproteobacteria bacterium]|nr:GNAT family N-acetyltransferase [Gammaproteobacteria bacterium]